MDFRLIFYLIKPQFYDDYRGLSLIVKATLRLASLGLDTPLKSSPSSFKIGFCKEKNRVFVTYVSELSVTHVTDCTGGSCKIRADRFLALSPIFAV